MVPTSGAVRPTQDAVREAVFSMLSNRLEACAFLDLYAGSGSVGLEAWSRGAAQVTWVEQSSAVLKRLRQNVMALCGEAASRWIVASDALVWLSRGCRGAAYDLIYLDPPYDQASADVPKILEKVIHGGYLVSGGIVVVEQRADTQLPEMADWDVITQRRYGQTGVWLLRRKTEDGEKTDTDA